MAGTESVVLFQRGDEEEYDSDVWDDTALIAAYDAAVAPLKAKLAEHTGDTSFLDGDVKQTHGSQQKKKKNKKKKSKKKQQVNGWRVGDHCQAVYTEDGAIYEAKIISISLETNTCVVRYLSYGNEEEQTLEDLMPSAMSASKKPKHQRSDSVSYSETDSVDTPRQSAGGHKGSRSTQGSTSQATHHSQGWSWPGFFGSGSMPPPLGPVPPPPGPPPPMFPGMPGPFGFLFPGMNSAAAMHLPTMPPPPPPMPVDEVPDENEAMCSMLLSWYMSGYHTGYYHGLRHARHGEMNGSAASAMGPSR